jgi:hypothetical protein
MTLEEKAGLTMMSILETGEAGDVAESDGLFPNATSTLIHDERMNHFNAPRLPGGALEQPAAGPGRSGTRRPIMYRLTARLVDCSTISSLEQAGTQWMQGGSDTHRDGAAALCIGACAGRETGRFSSSARHGGRRCGSPGSC